MNRGESLTAATRRAGLSRKLFTPLASKRRLIKRKGRRWVVNDSRTKRVLVASRGRLQKIRVDRFEDASLAGSHYVAIGHFVRTNDISLLEPYEGLFVRAANGKRFPLETDPYELHRLAAMDSPWSTLTTALSRSGGEDPKLFGYVLAATLALNA